MTAPIVYFLLGYPGVGKHTIGTAMVARHADQPSRLVLVDNHYVNNPIFGLLDVDGTKPIPAEAWGHARSVRDAVLATIRSLSPADWSFIFTNYLADQASEADAFREISELADTRASVFLPVVLRCEEGEHLRRFTDPRRAARLKWRDPAGLQRVIRELRQLVPDHVNLRELDVTGLEPAQAADVLLKWGAELAT